MGSKERNSGYTHIYKGWSTCLSFIFTIIVHVMVNLSGYRKEKGLVLALTLCSICKVLSQINR